MSKDFAQTAILVAERGTYLYGFSDFKMYIALKMKKKEIVQHYEILFFYEKRTTYYLIDIGSLDYVHSIAIPIFFQRERSVPISTKGRNH